MTIQDLYRLVAQTYVNAGLFTITSQTAASLGSTAVTALVGNSLLLPNGRVQLTAAMVYPPGPGADSFSISGTLTDAIPAASASIVAQIPDVTTVTFTLDDTGTPQMEVAAVMKPQWTLASTFTELAGTDLGEIVWGAAGFVLASADRGTVYKGLNFRGPLLPGGLPMFLPLTAFFSDPSDIILAGAITLEAAQPLAMDLTTPSAQAEQRIGSVTALAQVCAACRQVNGKMTSELSLLCSIELPSVGSLCLQGTLTAEDAPLILALSVGQNLPNGLTDLNCLCTGNVFGGLIPARFPMGAAVTLGTLSIGIYRGRRSARIESISASVTLGGVDWTLIPDLVSVSGIAIEFTLFDPFGNLSVSAAVSACFDLGGSDQDQLAVSVGFPPGSVSGGLTYEKQADGSAMAKPIQLGTFIAKLFGGAVPTSNTTLVINQLEFAILPSAKTYSFRGGIGGNLTIPGVSAKTLDVTEVVVTLDRSQAGTSMSFIGLVTFLDHTFELEATKSGTDGEWTFGGQLAPSDQNPGGNDITLKRLADELLPSSWGITVPSQLNGLRITELDTQFTPSAGTFTLDTAFDWAFQFDGAAAQYDIAAQIHLQSSKAADGTKSYSGSVAGSLDFNGLALAVIYEFAPNAKEVTFRYETLTVTYAPAQPPAQQGTLIIAFGNSTLANLLGFILELAVPGTSIRFPSPWDKLLDINLDNLSITIHLATKLIEVTYMHDFNFGFVDIQGLGITYQRQFGRPKVMMQLYGNFLGTTYTRDNPLAWDALNGQPPAAASGGSVVEIMYVGLGQHVTLQAMPGPTVESVIQQMKGCLLPPANPAQNPLSQMPGLVYDAGSHWMIGGEFLLDNTFLIDLVFNDPQVYGLLIDVDGPRGGALQGLKFEVLYRKISDSIGLYHIDFNLPWEFRHFEFGEVSVTLPEFILDIYTNGNFKIDVGFPPSLTDFTHSFAVEVFPFVGFGGFYFSSLDGQTSSSVPQASNGRFTPVIEFGFALSLGVGKTFSAGILSGGISITLLGELQGTFATFHPADTGLAGSTYYDLIGTVALVGELYGSVDFVLIKASVSLTIFASLQLEAQSHEPILITASVGVDVSASVKIIFVTIHFHFSMTVSESFTIGSHTQTPWILAPDTRHPALQANGSAPMAALAAHLAAAATTAPGAGPLGRRAQPGQANPMTPAASRGGPAIMAAGHCARSAGGRPMPMAAARFGRATPRRRLTLAPRALGGSRQPTLWVTPVVTMASDDDLSGSGKSAPVPVICTLLSIGTSLDAAAPTLAGKIVGTGTPSDFDTLAEALLTWVIGDLVQESDSISAAELLDIKLDLTDPAVLEDAFTVDKLNAFLAGNISFTLAARPLSGDNAAAVFPMPPFLSMASSQVAVDFASKNAVDAGYEAGIDAYLGMLTPDYANHAEKAGPGGGKAARGVSPAGGNSQSFAAYLFCNYFVAIMRQLVEAGIQLLTQYPATVTASSSLQTVANDFPQSAMVYRSRRGDTLLSIAHLVRLPPDDIQAANPTLGFVDLPVGTAVSIPVKVTPESIVVGNWQTRGLLQSGQVLTLGYVSHPVTAGETLASVAKSFGITAAALAEANAGAEGLFVQGAQLRLGTLATQVRDGDTVQSVAALFGNQGAAGLALAPRQTIVLPAAQAYARVRVAAGMSLADVAHVHNVTDLPSFYAAVLAANPDLGLAPSSTPVAIADVVHGVSGAGFILPYRVQAGDTLAGLIAAYYPEPNPEAAQANIQSTNPQIDLTKPLVAGTRLRLPLSNSFRSIAKAYGLGGPGNPDVGDLLADVAGIYGAQAVFAVPSFTGTVQAGDTFESLARRYNLTATELSDVIATQTGLFVAGAPVIVPDVPAIAIETLKTRLQEQGAYTNAAGMVSRFFLHGLRLPFPGEATFTAFEQDPTPDTAAKVATRPLYVLTGQEFAADLAGPQLTLVREGKDPGWLTFAGGGTSLTIDLTDELALAKTLAGSAPAASKYVDPQMKWMLPDPGYAWAPRRHPIRHFLNWHAQEIPAGLSNPAQVTGDLTIWPMPDSAATLLTEAGEGGLPLAIESATRRADGSLAVAPVAPAIWATTIPIAIRKVPPANGETKAPAGVYLIEGADDDGARRLLSLRQHLLTQTGEEATPYLLYPPNASDTNAQGLLSGALDRAATVVLKTNLSTLAHPDPVAHLLAAAPPAPVPNLAHFEPSGTADLLALLFECSVVRSGGYYLSCPNLPDEAFSGGSEVTLTLLVVLKQQNSAAIATAYAFNNAAVVGVNIDTAHAHLFVSQPVRQISATDTLDSVALSFAGLGLDAASLAVANQDLIGVLTVGASLANGATTWQVKPGDTIAMVSAALGYVSVANFGRAVGGSRGLLAPGAYLASGPGQLIPKASATLGVVGFRVARTDPATNTKAGPLDSLYSLCGFRLKDDGGFRASVEGMPPGPTDQRPAAGPANPAADDNLWLYHQTLCISAFAVDNPVPDSKALPPTTSNPYAGCGTGAQASVELVFQDIFGNRVDPSSDHVGIPVRFTDDILTPDRWPGLSRSYRIRPVAGRAQLDVVLTGSAARYVAGPGRSAAQVAGSATSDRDHMARIWYQLHGLRTASVSLCGLGAITPTTASVTESDALIQTLLDQAMQSWVFLAGAATLTAQTYTPAANDTLGGMAATYSVTAGDVLTANADKDLVSVFADPAQVLLPTYRAVAQTDTAAALAGGDLPQNLAALASRNPSAPLTAGMAIVRPAVSLSVPDGTSTLAALVLRAGTVLTDTVVNGKAVVQGLATANRAVPLADGLDLILVHDGTSGSRTLSTTTSGNTLASVAQEFTTQLGEPGVTIAEADVAVANQHLSGLFAKGQALSVTAVLVPAQATLAEMAAIVWQGQGDAAAQLLSSNSALPGLFRVGTPLVTGSRAANLTSGDTAATLAAEQGLQLEDLGRVNLALALAPTALTVPNLCRTDGPAYGVYRTAAGDTLNVVLASRPGWTMDELAALNGSVRGLFLPGATVNGKVVSLSDTPAQLAGSTDTGVITTFLNGIAATSGLLRPGAVILTPAMAATDGDTFAALAAASGPYYADPATAASMLAQANASLAQLRQGQSVTCRGAQLITGAHDTLTTLVERFNLALSTRTIGVADILTNNPKLALAATPILLCPPGQTVFSAAVNPFFDPACPVDPAFPPSACFPLNIELTLARDPAAVLDALQSGHAASATTFIPADALQNDAEGSHGLTSFADDFAKALPGLVVATGPRTTADGAHRVMAGSTDPCRKQPSLWVVNFGSQGPRYNIAAGPGDPTFFAVAPLATTAWTCMGAEVATYTSGKGLGPEKPVNMVNEVPDHWAAQLLALIDTALSPACATAALALDAAALGQIIEAKGNLADRYAGRIADIAGTGLASADPVASAAREALRQQMLTSLSSAYTVESVAAFPFTVSAIGGGATGARLFAKPSVVGTTASFVVTAGSRLSEAADLFGTTVGEVLRANQGAAVFAPNTTVTIGGTSKLPSGSTPTDVAATFGLDVAAIANALWMCDLLGDASAYTLQPGATLTWTEPLPQFDLSAAALPLTDGSASLVSLFTVAQPERRKTVILDLDLQVSAMQIGIDPNTGLAGYEQSSWLHFVLPFDVGAATRLGQTVIPVPLRDYPSLGSLGNQVAVTGGGQPAGDWTYQVDLTRPMAAQDVVSLRLMVDVPSADPSAAQPPPSPLATLFRVLAAVGKANHDLSADLRLLANPVLVGDDGARAKGALGALASLATQAVGAWPHAEMPHAAASPSLCEGRGYDFSLTPIPSDAKPAEFGWFVLTSPGDQPRVAFGVANVGQSDIDALNRGVVPPILLKGFTMARFDVTGLTVTAAPHGGWEIRGGTPEQSFSVETVTAGNATHFRVRQLVFWPDVSKPAAGGGTPAPVLSGTADTRLLQVEADIGAAVCLRFAFPRLGVLYEQNAMAAHSVTRNLNLLPGGQATNPVFVYQAPPLATPTPVTATILDQSTTVLSGPDLGSALKTFFDGTFEQLEMIDSTASRYATLRGRYSGPLAAVGSDSLCMEFPLTISTSFYYPADGECSFPQDFARSLEAVAGQFGVPARAGSFVVELAISADLGGNPGAPLLTYTTLLYARQ